MIVNQMDKTTKSILQCFALYIIYGEGLLYMDKLMIRSCNGRWSFMNAFYNNLNTINLFPNRAGIFT